MIDYIIIFIAIIIIIDIVAIYWVLLRSHREPASRIAWVAGIILLPVIGAVIYLLLGEVNIGRKRTIKLQKIQDKIQDSIIFQPDEIDYASHHEILQYKPLFKLATSISHFKPVVGNIARLLDNSKVAMDTIIADIETASHNVHLQYYIWQPDETGRKVAEALRRAVQRGVKCRVMVDAVGSSELVKSPLWVEMRENGIQLVQILPIGNPLRKIIKSRIDLRNHRKIVNIDNDITYCGSQNCMNTTFAHMPELAWVDIVLRFKGPIARQNQQLFINDWMMSTGEDLGELLTFDLHNEPNGFVAQVIGTGPTSRHLAMSQMFVALAAIARRELVITTPYYVPNAAIQSVLQAAAHKGVDVKLILPAKNDSWVLSAVSQSYYQELLEAGVKIYEYESGLLHTKSITIDGEFAMIGSANIDRRSFELNYENNMLIADENIVQKIVKRQRSYIDQSRIVSLDILLAWSKWRKLLNNIMAMFGPIL